MGHVSDLGNVYVELGRQHSVNPKKKKEITDNPPCIASVVAAAAAVLPFCAGLEREQDCKRIGVADAGEPRFASLAWPRRSLVSS